MTMENVYTQRREKKIFLELDFYILIGETAGLNFIVRGKGKF